MFRQYGGTPLHNATDNNNEDVVKLLIEKGANVNVEEMWVS